MSEIAQSKSVVVSLSCGAIVTLYRLLQGTGWNKTAKEKYAAGKIQERLEPVCVAAPDPVGLAPSEPGFQAAALKYQHDYSKWERSAGPGTELGDFQFQTVQACLRHAAGREEVSVNRFFAELQEQFRLME